MKKTNKFKQLKEPQFDPNILEILSIFFFALLFLSGCTVTKPQISYKDPAIRSVDQQRVQLTKKNIQIKITGSDFDKNSKVQLLVASNNELNLKVDPKFISSKEILVNIPNAWLEKVQDFKIPAKNYHFFKAIPVNSVKVLIINPGERKSNTKTIELRTPILTAEKITIADKKPNFAYQGVRKELVLHVNQSEFIGDVPVIVYGVPSDQDNNSLLSKIPKKRKIWGKGIISQGKRKIRIPFDIDSDVPPGRYIVNVLVDIDNLNIKNWRLGQKYLDKKVSVTSGNRTQFSKELTEIFEQQISHGQAYGEEPYIEVQKVTPQVELGGFPPAAPEILAIHRIEADQFKIIFKDNAFNESGYRLYRNETEGLHQWELMGNIGKVHTPYNQGEFIDSNIYGKSYEYRVAAWNKLGETHSEDQFADPPKYLPTEISLVHFDQDEFRGILISWKDDNVEDYPVSIIQNLSRGLIQEVVRETKDFQLLSKEGFKGFFQRTNKLDGKLNYQILIGSKEYGFAVGEIKLEMPSNLPLPPSHLKEENRGGTISWIDNSDNERKFIIELWREATKKWETCDTLNRSLGTGKEVSFIPEWIPLPGERYAYIVYAVNENGKIGVYNSTDLSMPMRMEFDCSVGNIFIPDCNPLEEDCCVWDWTGFAGREEGDIGYGKYEKVKNPYPGSIYSPWAPEQIAYTWPSAAHEHLPLPEDGWVLIRKEFTLDQEENPYFIIYNKFDGRLRIYFYHDIENENYDENAISLSFDLPGQGGEKTNVLMHGGNRSYAQDFIRNNRFDVVLIAPAEFDNIKWTWAEFLMAYDEDTHRKVFPILTFKKLGINESLINLSGEVNLNTPNSFSGKEYSSSTGEDLLELFGKVKTGYETASSLAEAINNKLIDMSSSEDNPIQSFFDGLQAKDELSDGEKFLEKVFGSETGEAVLDAIPIIGAAVGLFSSLFSTSGDNSPVISLSGSINLSGKSISKESAGRATFRIPGSKEGQYHKGDTLFYDYPLGTFTLKETPILIQALEKDFGFNQDLKKQQNTFRVLDNLKYLVNPASGLKVKEVYGSIVFSLGGQNSLIRHRGSLFYNNWEDPAIGFEHCFCFPEDDPTGRCTPDNSTKQSEHFIKDKFHFLGVDTTIIARMGIGLLHFRVPNKICRYGTPFIPYDKIGNFPLYTDYKPWLAEEKKCDAFKSIPVGIRIIALLEYTPPGKSIKKTILFSDFYEIYFNHFNYFPPYQEKSQVIKGFDTDKTYAVLFQDLKKTFTNQCDSIKPDYYKSFFQNALFVKYTKLEDFRDSTVKARIDRMFQEKEIEFFSYGTDQPMRLFWKTPLYDIFNPWPEIVVGNLILNHEVVTPTTHQNVFRKDERISIEFIQYKELKEELNCKIYYYNDEVEDWVFFLKIPMKEFKVENYSNFDSEDREWFSMFLDYEPEHAKRYKHIKYYGYTIADKFKVVISQGEKVELEQEFRIVK